MRVATPGPVDSHCMLQLISSRDSIIPRSRLPASDCAAEQQPAVDGASMASTYTYVAALEMSMAHIALLPGGPQGSAHAARCGVLGQGRSEISSIIELDGRKV